MNWIILVFAGLFEVAFAFCLGKAKDAIGTSMYLWYGGFLFCSILSFLLLIKAMQTIPIGTGYAVWTGIGAVGSVILGILVFKDPVNFWRIFFILTLICSIIGLKFFSN